MATLFICGTDDGIVRRLLRSRSTHQYFNDGQWTQDPREARSFGDALEAAEACNRYGLMDVELALRVSYSEYDVFCTTIR